MATTFYIGKRLSYNGQLCTVRYQGEVQGTKGDWLGVEWDDPTRGKHSGQNGGIKYFECLSKSPTAASFVRLARKPDPPRSFVEALKAKYASEGFEDPDVKIIYERQDNSKDHLAHQNRPIRISGKEVEEVGFDKIRKQLANLKELKIVILDGLCMSRPVARATGRREEDGPDVWPTDLTDIKESCPKTIELDLSRNLFEEWREIASICEQLEKLRSLRADGNRFRDTSITDQEHQRCLKAFANIKMLRLEETLLSWQEIADITTQFPALTTFVAASNSLSSLSNHFLTECITDLSLEDNHITTISDIEPLTKLPNLQRLVLKSNRISDISRPGEPLPVFSKTLTELDLSFNEIANWALINKLETVFPGLTALRVSHNPLYHSLQAADGRPLTADDGYMLTLARLGNLTSLNYSPITAKERLNAEAYYLSLIGRELNFSSADLEKQILASHPRYEYLISNYGEPVINRSTNAVNPNSLAARLIRFTFYLGESAKQAITHSLLSEGEKRVEAEIPRTCTAYTLLGIVGQKFNIPPKKCRLVWETGDWVPAPRTEDIESEDWDSESSDDDDAGSEKEVGRNMIMREVEIVPGTKAAGNWVEGQEATVRVELR